MQPQLTQIETPQETNHHPKKRTENTVTTFIRHVEVCFLVDFRMSCNATVFFYQLIALFESLTKGLKHAALGPDEAHECIFSVP